MLPTRTQHFYLQYVSVTNGYQRYINYSLFFYLENYHIELQQIPKKLKRTLVFVPIGLKICIMISFRVRSTSRRIESDKDRRILCESIKSIKT